MKRPKTGGRQKGTPNRVTKTAREAFMFAAEKIGGAERLARWAEQNETEFFKLYARLIPQEVTGEEGQALIPAVVKHIYETAKVQQK